MSLLSSLVFLPPIVSYYYCLLLMMAIGEGHLLLMRRSVFRVARRKWGQRTWSPTASAGGAAPANGVSAQEALQIAYRPMPLPQTVEYEEDFGHNMMIHREFISKRHRDGMSFDIGALAYSEVELRRGKQHLAGIMNRERRGVAIGTAGAPDDQVRLQTDVDASTREVTSARFLFNEKRLMFCDRFQNFFRGRLKGANAPHGTGGAGDDAQSLFSLMEACAVIYGCETNTAREAYFRMFLALDLDSLEEEDEALRNRIAEANAVQQALEERAARGTALAWQNMEEGQQAGECQLLHAASSSIHHAGDSGSNNNNISNGNNISGDDNAFIASIPELSLFADFDQNQQVGVRGETEGKVAAVAAVAAVAVVEGEAGRTRANDADSGSPYATTPQSSHSASSQSHVLLPEEFEEYAPMYRTYLAHASGQSRIATYDFSSLGSTSITAERRRWRALMDMIVMEDYHKMTEEQVMDAAVLSEQLHTVKFFDLKVGDTVREIVQLHQRETGNGSSLNRDTPLEASPNHPERRV